MSFIINRKNYIRQLSKICVALSKLLFFESFDKYTVFSQTSNCFHPFLFCTL